MNFVAIDFETANEKRNSVCALGIVLVNNGDIVEKRSWLIKPLEVRFAPINIFIHGITAEDVKFAPKFNEIWSEISPYLENNIIVAHNAGFDISVLREILSTYRIPFPKSKYFCSLKTAKKIWPGLFSYRLNDIADHLAIDFIHHKAEDDAYACCEIIKKACEKNQYSSINELISELNFKVGELSDSHYSPAKYTENIRSKDVKPENFDFNNDHPFLNKHLTFTGKLESMQRKEAIQKVVNVGGYGSDNVTEETRYLVVGELDYRTLKDGNKSNKIKRAEQLLVKGQKIEMITEMDFLKML